MITLHAKSPCCRGKIIRFGNRRRQCVTCRKTWRVWQRKRGRDKKRVNKKLLEQLFGNQVVSVRKEAERRGTHESTLRRRLAAALRHYEQEPWVITDCPKPVVLLADAIIKRIRRKWWTVYFTAIKMPDNAQAFLLPPVVMAYRESYAGWRSVLNAIPDGIHSAIKALVCDGHRGLVYYARWSGWQVQRCQAHLLFSISGRRSHSPWSRHRQEGSELYDLTKSIFKETNAAALVARLNAIEAMGWETKSPQLKRIIDGFVNVAMDYRACLKYPELDIPATNNALESFISQFQELCHRARGFATIRSLTGWVSGFTKYKKHITCNGFHQPN